MLTAVGLGFLLGVRHAFDADHVIAVSTLVTRHRSPWTASWVGASWGIGHALMILGVGALVIGLRVAVPDRFVAGAELGVGLLLVALGAVNLVAVGRSRRSGAAVAERPIRRTLASSGAVGLAHGLAGSGALALLATAAMPTPATAIAYLVVFGIGTVFGMVAISVALGAPLAAAGNADAWRTRLTAGAGLASVALGLWLIHRVGFVAGLLA